MTSFAEFLVEAKKNTYASKGEGGEKRLPDGTRELSFSQGDFFYRDRYFGSNPFGGEELVFQGKEAIWLMNYFGHCQPMDGASQGEIYSFLKACLKKASVSAPFRGPQEFGAGEFLYENKFIGDLEAFSGEEAIYHQGQAVYRLKYHGGVL